MSELVDRLFPEEFNEDEVLGGYKDYVDGQAKEFFKALSEKDRELVQWFIISGWNPVTIEQYAYGLAVGLHKVDPDRSSEEAIKGAHEEIARVKRFIDLFVQGYNYFPQLSHFSFTQPDEDGKGYHKFFDVGWGNIMYNPLARNARQDFEEHGYLEIDLIDRFIDDPSVAPGVFSENEDSDEFYY